MNPAQLLAQFDRNSAAPDAIPRLRRFILDLAVRGKLVEQDPRDEPAPELLRRIQTEKSRLVKSGEIRAPRESEASDEEDVPFQLPANWIWCRLSEAGAIIGGGTPPSGDLDNFTDGGSGVAWLTPADLGKHNALYVSHGARDLTPQGLRSSSATLMPKGSVLFTSRAPIGYTAIASNEISTNQGFKSVVPYILDCNIYIAVYFRAFAKWIDGKASGTTFREVSGKIVGNLPFPLPPLAEQQRIVAKVDELMTLCDRLEAAQAERESRRDRLVASSLNLLNNGADADAFRDHARFYFNHLARLTTKPEHIQQLRQTILNLAVSGKLVPQISVVDAGRPSETLATQHEPTDDLDKPESDSGLHSGAPPFTAPDGWKWARVRDVLITRQGVQIPKEQQLSEAKPGYKRYLYISDFRHDDKLKYVLDQFPSKEVTEEDLVMANTAGPGEIFRGVPGILSNNLFKIAFDRCLFIQNYLFIFFTSPIFTSAVEAELKGGAQQHLGHKLMGKQFIVIPPLAEQQRIVAKVEELMALCDRLEAQLTTTQAESLRLLEAVLHEALAPAV